MCSRIYARTAGNASFFIFFLGVPPGGPAAGGPAFAPLRRRVPPARRGSGCSGLRYRSGNPFARCTGSGLCGRLRRRPPHPSRRVDPVAEKLPPAPCRSPAFAWFTGPRLF
ncbi:MAG: hypothetical protein NZM15_01965, partial [Flavobacteriales bacterium]|nr:hypothetical protein [Flavobacteriales bacterium]MDW8431450.1 hypothetical protein [Flavobacteriales bacterium]